MRKLATAVMIALPIALFSCACYLVLSSPPEPPFDWRLHMSEAQHAAAVAPINHLYTRAAYTVTWAIQLGYLAWMGLRWQSQKRKSPR
ncbi:MAG: hypothetical protein ABSF23_13725 [Terracidiphilus sp.]|jgi:hypothetical protein